MKLADDVKCDAIAREKRASSLFLFQNCSRYTSLILTHTFANLIMSFYPPRVGKKKLLMKCWMRKAGNVNEENLSRKTSFLPFNFMVCEICEWMGSECKSSKITAKYLNGFCFVPIRPPNTKIEWKFLAFRFYNCIINSFNEKHLRAHAIKVI